MKQHIEDYDFPQELKTMPEEDLDILAFQIREFLINKVSRTGGHLASNLGVVELTIALHRIFDTPRDKLIWDVGHQSYVHKILTGRAGGFDTLRQTGGMSGFPKAKESLHDAYDTGHSSTSLSAAAGYARARDLQGENYNVVAIIGDGSLTGGMAFEALNNIGSSGSRVIIILNDNGMSISKNIGGLSQHLGNLRTSNKYITAKRKVRKRLNKIPVVGKTLADSLSTAKDRVKYALLNGGVLFEELGFTYLGPIDGHKTSSLLEALNQTRRVDGPVLLHVVTEKGRGYSFAEKNPNKFHGIGPFDPRTGEIQRPSGITYSKVMGKTLLDLADKDSRIVAVSAAMGTATGLGPFARKYPKRFFDVGIAEAHAVTFSAGMAKGGLKPLVAIYSSFLQRGYDQIVEDVALQDLPVVFAVDRAGVVGADGETHHGNFDLPYFLSTPNMTVLAPNSGDELRSMLRYAFQSGHPCAIRYPRGECELGEDKKEIFDGKNKRLKSGIDAEIWAVGRMTGPALEASQILKEAGFDVGVVYAAQLKPLELSLLSDAPELIFTAEDGGVTGGYGQCMNSAASRKGHKIFSFGWPDKFIEHGKPEDLYEKYGLDGRGLAERIGEILEEGKA